MTLIGTDPDDPELSAVNAWKVVQELKITCAGNLFVKTHPKSKNLWADAPQNPEQGHRRVRSRSATMTDLTKAQEDHQRRQGLAGLPETKAINRAVHPEYSADGDGSVDLAVGRQDRASRRSWS